MLTVAEGKPIEVQQSAFRQHEHAPRYLQISRAVTTQYAHYLDLRRRAGQHAVLQYAYLRVDCNLDLGIGNTRQSVIRIQIQNVFI